MISDVEVFIPLEEVCIWVQIVVEDQDCPPLAKAILSDTRLIKIKLGEVKRDQHCG